MRLVISNEYVLVETSIRTLSLRLSNLRDLTMLRISDCHLDDEGMIAISPFLPFGLKQLDFSSNQISFVGIEGFVPYIPAYLDSLSFCENKLGVRGAHLLSINLPQSLKNLSISSNLLGTSGLDGFIPYLPSRLKSLNIALNSIRGGFSNLSLLFPPGLEVLDLRHNSLGSDGIETLLQFIPQSLKEINLSVSGNELTNSGAQAILKSLSKNNLNSIIPATVLLELVRKVLGTPHPSIMDDPLSASTILPSSSSSSITTTTNASTIQTKEIKQQKQNKDFESELKHSQDPNSLLVRWCVEGRPRVTAALSEDGSIVRLAAQLLSETTHKSYGASAIEQTIEVQFLKAAFMHKTGQSFDALIELRRLLSLPKGQEMSSFWKRRLYAAIGWILASLGDYRSCIKTSIIDGLQDESLLDEDRFALLIAATRIRTEIGDVIGARENFDEARMKYSHFLEDKKDARSRLAEARLCFAEGNIDQAAQIWHHETTISTQTVFFPSIPVESLASWLASFAIGAVIGDLGDFIVEGSRWARHEAANNFAVCALHAGRLDGAVTALEEVMKSFGAPGVVDSVAACNLKTLYELCRTPDHSRLIN